MVLNQLLLCNRQSTVLPLNYPIVLSSFKYLSFSTASRTLTDIALAEIQAVIPSVIFVIRKNHISLFRYLHLLARMDIQRIVLESVRTVWTRNHAVVFTTAGARKRIVPCTYRTAHIIPVYLFERPKESL